jgi:deazaflavin-dependent oxidoreductase (nitroreductase family)
MNSNPLSRRAWDVVLKTMNAVHRTVLWASRGRLLDSAFGMQTVELHTVGRKSGQRRSVLLTAPISKPGLVVLVASKGGDDRDPDWYRNLVANPAIHLTVHGHEAPWTARTATPEEREALWPTITSAYGGYAAYQKRTARTIPVVICEPRA